MPNIVMVIENRQPGYEFQPFTGPEVSYGVTCLNELAAIRKASGLYNSNVTRVNSVCMSSVHGIGSHGGDPDWAPSTTVNC